MSNVSAHIDAYLDREAVAGLAVRAQEALGDTAAVTVTPQHEVDVECPVRHVTEVLRWCRDRAGMAALMDICGVDWLGMRPDGERFAVVYHLLNMTENLRLRVTVRVAEGEAVPTAIPVWEGANWYEREVWDMFGIPFNGHPDLRRLLTDYDFDGHPLRKDFPLEGHVETYYDKTNARVAYKPVDLPQKMRTFDAASDWAGMTGNTRLAEEDNVFSAKEFK